LANLLLWIIVAIGIFHLGVGKCGEELLVVDVSSIRLQPWNNSILKHIVWQVPTILRSKLVITNYQTHNISDYLFTSDTNHFIPYQIDFSGTFHAIYTENWFCQGIDMNIDHIDRMCILWFHESDLHPLLTSFTFNYHYMMNLYTFLKWRQRSADHEHLL